MDNKNETMGDTTLDDSWYRIDLTPDGIRTLVDGSDDEEWVRELHDSDLRTIGQDVIGSDWVWDSVHESLSIAIGNFRREKPLTVAAARAVWEKKG